ncbi:MAG: aldose epimerase family protein [Verrucomicrobiota bacterium]
MVNLNQIIPLATVILVTSACPGQSVETETWGTTPSGETIELHTLVSPDGAQAQVADYGALLVSVQVPDLEGNLGEVTLRYQKLDEALSGGVYGSVIGRFANRIGGGGFSIDHERFDLDSVNAKTQVHIHGGKTGFHRQVWQSHSGVDDQSPFVTFSLDSPDGHEGYPGNVTVSVTYRFLAGNVLTLEYQGITDRPTHLNLTNHVYFNLKGQGDILDHELQLHCDEVLEFDPHKVPTGKRLPVKDTAFDLRSPFRLGDVIESVEGGGYDHCLVVSSPDSPSKLSLAAELIDPKTGRTLKVSTTKPGLQLYTANHLKGDPFPRWGGICFETQYFPDTPNQPGFPSSLLRPGESYHHLTQFDFGIFKN